MSEPVILVVEIEKLLARLRARGYAAATIAQYHWFARDFGRYLEAARITDLRGVLRSHIESYKAELRTRKLSQSTQAQALQAVERLFDSLIDRGVLLLNPVASVQKLSRRQQLPRWVPSSREVERLLGAADTSRRTGVRDRAMLELVYGSALRVGELCGLELSDIDLDNLMVRVRGKGNKTRVVPVGKASRQWLAEYLADVRPWWTRNVSHERSLFVTNRGEPLSTGSFRQNLLHLSEVAGLRRVSPHALRHAAATHMVANGADVRYVQQLLGHAHVTTTQIYTRVAVREVKATHARTHPREQQR